MAAGEVSHFPWCCKHFHPPISSPHSITSLSMVKEFAVIRWTVCSQDTNICSYSQQETAKSKICSLGPALPQMPQQEREWISDNLSPNIPCVLIQIFTDTLWFTGSGRRWFLTLVHQIRTQTGSPCALPSSLFSYGSVCLSKLQNFVIRHCFLKV